MRSIQTLWGVVIAASMMACVPAAGKPNIIVINIDDMGYADIGPFGSKLNRTPNLDRLGQEGRTLTCFYAAPSCSPSRASLMTGCYPKRVLPIPGVLFPAGRVGLNPDEVTVAELLKDAGYTTGCIGKWHLGDQPEFLPNNQGFDYYLGLPYSNDMGPVVDGAKHNLGAIIPAQPTATKNDSGPRNPASDEKGIMGRNQPPLPLLENRTVIDRIDRDGQQGIEQRYTEAAVKFIRDNKQRVFLLYLPHTAVHFPIYPGKRWAGNSPHGIYSDWVEEVDWSVGQVLDTVRELGLSENTMILFTSDNGGTQRAENAPLRGFKGSTWEGGMRVPTIAWWPGKIPAGTSTDELCGMMDLLPTLVRLGGGVEAADRKLDGRDIWPLLSGAKDAKSPHDQFYYYNGLKLEAVRSGPWKLRFATADAGTDKSEAKDQLFNLRTDIGERTDLADAYPDTVRSLRVLADKMALDLGVDGIGPGCRPLGRVTNEEPLIHYDGTIRGGFEPK